MNAHTSVESHIVSGVLSLEEAVQQLVNLGEHDPLTITRKIEQRYEEDWLKEELYALRSDIICEIARARVNGGRRAAMVALRKAKSPMEKGVLLNMGEWVPNSGWKKLRDWTVDDLQVRANYYVKISNTSLKLAQWCIECIDLMEVEQVKTLGKVKADLPVLNEAEVEAIENGNSIESVTS